MIRASGKSVNAVDLVGQAAALHGHHGRRHARTQRLRAAGLMLPGLAFDDADRAPGLHDDPFEAKPRAARGRQQVDLEFDRQHRGIGRHQ